MQRMDIYGVSFDLVGKQPIVLLKTAEGNRFLPIWIGHAEAAAILMRIQGASTPRPMTHDLLSDIIGKLDAEVVRGHGHRASRQHLLREHHRPDERLGDRGRLAPLATPSRWPCASDAPIFAADDVIEESAIEFEGEEGPPENVATMSPEQRAQVEEQFKEFLENVTPDQFAAAEPEDD